VFLVTSTLGLTTARTLVIPEWIDGVTGMVSAGPGMLNCPGARGVFAHGQEVILSKRRDQDKTDERECQRKQNSTFPVF
jgi:hypothetical protein